MTDANRRIVLAERPTTMVDERTTRLEEGPVPSPGPGQALVRVTHLSIDPTIRGWMGRDTYLPAIGIGEVVRCAGLGQVVESRREGVAVGDTVFGLLGWQDYAVVGDVNTVPHVDQAEIGGEAGDAEQAERQFGRDPRRDGADVFDDGVVLPAEQAEHGVPDGHAVMLGLDDLADAGRSDHVAEGDRWKVGVAAHPPPDGGVNGQVRHPDEGLAGPG